jgi:hypothetical protein
MSWSVLSMLQEEGPRRSLPCSVGGIKYFLKMEMGFYESENLEVGRSRRRQLLQCIGMKPDRIGMLIGGTGTRRDGWQEELCLI